MMRRPEGMDPEVWKAQRAAYWKKVNRFWNVLLVLGLLALAARYFGWLPSR
ncbi:MAG TPA: hypothetical protein VMR50_16465 [Myxococcota bacterium]|nr:hypothetical protein [Myxococcota bacterium]